MLALSCCHTTNACVSSIPLVTNIVEETQLPMEQDVYLSGASSNVSSSSTIFCLMAKESKVSPTLNPIESDDDVVNNEENDIVDSLNKKGEIVFLALSKNKNARSNFMEIMANAIEVNKLIYEHEDTIVEMEGREQGYTDEIGDLSIALNEEQERRRILEEKLCSLEESYNLDLSKLRKDHALTLSNVLKSKNDDACATNSTYCEASILKENVELRAQLELLTSNYRKLEESHEKLSSSHNDLLVSHDRLKLAHEATSTKVTSCEPHVDNGTTSTLNAILSCTSLIHPLTMLLYLVMNYFPCLVALTLKHLLPLVFLLILTIQRN